MKERKKERYMYHAVIEIFAPPNVKLTDAGRGGSDDEYDGREETH